jgi:hypothetical protein
MSTVVYLSYGKGPHEQEVIFSLLSAWYWAMPGRDDVRFAVYTDHPETFAGLPVEIEKVSPKTWGEWSGPAGFNHRRKIMALRHAIGRWDAKTVLLDGDTWWRNRPAVLFDRIGPGRSTMHLREGRVETLRHHSPTAQALATLFATHSFTDFHGHTKVFESSEWMWNSGVIGLDPADAGLLDEVLYWNDALCSVARLHVLEQFALGYVLGQRTRLEEAGDCVWHYWPCYMIQPFRKRLPGIMAATCALPLAERAAACYRHRPRPTPARRAKSLVMRGLQVIGLQAPRPRCSEW